MKEITMFEYHDKGTDSYYNKKHFHDREFEILHIISSGGGVVMVKDKLYPIKADTIFFIDGCDAHCSVPENPEEYIRSKIVFSGDFIKNPAQELRCDGLIEDLFIAGGSAVELTAKASAEIDSLILKTAEALHENKASSTLNVFINIFSIIDIAIQNKEKYISPVNNKTSLIIDYINRNCDKKLTLDDICENASISKYYLCHTFRDTVGMTVFDYVKLTRLAKAKKQLSDTTAPIASIALDCGFESFAYFTKVFKASEGITPREYRKLMSGTASLNK